MAQWWAEWNLNSGQVCPARGYPGKERRRPDQRNDETQSWELGVRSTQCLLHKSGWMCIFWLRNVLSPKSWCLNISVPTHAETGSLAVVIEQWMVSPRIAHHSPPPPQLWNVVEWSHSHRALHTSPSQISPPSKPGSDFLGAPPCCGPERSQFLMKSLSVSAIYQPAPVPALPLICIVFTQLSPGANS